VSVTCTLEQVFWTLVHGQVYTLHKCVFSPTYTSANTLATGCAHMCIFIHLCICMHMYMDAYVRLWYCMTHWGVQRLLRFSICAYVCICMYMCVHVCVYRCMWLCMYMLGWWVCVCLYTRIHTHKLLGYLMWAQVWDGHLEDQKNPDWLKRSIHVDRIGVHSTFVYLSSVVESAALKKFSNP